MTYQLAVFGNPVAHSLSPQIHHEFAAQVRLDVDYRKVLVEAEEFTQTAEAFFAKGGKGFNITVPHKFLAYQFAAEVSQQAELAQAVNTLVSVDGTIRGENTDGWGLLKDIEQNLGWNVTDQRILLIGAGGAAQGVLADLLERKPAQLVIANRTLSKAKELVTRFKDAGLSACRMEDLLELDAFDLVISASSAGLSAETKTDYLPYNIKHEQTCCYDMIYGKQTQFLTWASDLPKAQVSDGLGMLVEQAARAFNIWFDIKVDTKPVLQKLRAEIEGQN